ncbi:hypothetical protein HBN50_03915 [Halobacteriovorax sp. GB3]|uniref:hypothetical protein n=1 Tax=Halobacteriovorax sp. GB3 TaxID=2719615 RepID=UPI00235DEFFD|nr:hypothetical protein [Halobacteriovorax sp. GB3]MDD0852226.1 hypothetical protein [Halobacteriovorax sp. GB3]
MKLTKIIGTLGLMTLSLNSMPALSAGQCPLKKTISFSQAMSIHSQSMSENDSLEFFDQCIEVLAEIKAQRNMAVDEWRYGKKNEAVQRLHSVLAEASRLNPYMSTELPPLSAQTIQNANSVAQVLKKTISENIKNKYIGIQVEFMMLNKLIDLALWTYDEIDSRYYTNLVDRYYGVSFFNSNIIKDHFEKVKTLSKKYLDLFDEVSLALASNEVELDMAYAMVASTKTLFSNSVYRRNLCEVNANIEAILNLIVDYRCDQIRVPSNRKVKVVRAELKQLRQTINNVYVSKDTCF